MNDIKKKVNKIISNKKFRSIVKLLIILLFVVLSLLVVNKHEHWSDEAQSFLLAKDTTIVEMFKYMRYEGTPPLWVLIIKLFLFCGGTYKTFFLLPIIFSTIGLILFEYKVKAPWYIKILFPFTYFIFYQYTIVVRSYCLIFPMLMLIAIIYKDRFEKSILFSLILFLFMNISLHSLVMAGSFYLIYIFDSIMTKKITNKKVLMSIGIIFLSLLLTTIITFPAADCSSSMGGQGESFFRVISEATVGSNLNVYVELILSVIVLSILLFTTNMKKRFNFLILLLPLAFILIFIRYQGWHVGIVWLLILFFLILNNQINDSKLVKFFVLCVCIVQIGWTITSINYDYNKQYSASKEVANYLQKHVEEDKIIYGLGYSKTAIQAYFEDNIFDNKLTDKTFYIWSHNNQELPLKETYDLDVDIYVISDFYTYEYSALIILLENNNYNKKIFKGNTYIKNNIYESEGYVVYEKINNMAV